MIGPEVWDIFRADGDMQLATSLNGVLHFFI